MAELSDVHWPAVRIGTPDCAALRYSSAAELGTVTFRSINEYGRSRDLLIDSRGAIFDIVSVTVPASFSRSRLFLCRLLNLSTPVHFTLAQREAGLGELKALLEKNVRENADFFEEGDDIYSIVADINRCETAEQLVRMF